MFHYIVCTNTYLIPLDLLFFMCVSANSAIEEGDPISERRAGHDDRRAERWPANRGGDPEVCHLVFLDSSHLLISHFLHVTYYRYYGVWCYLQMYRWHNVTNSFRVLSGISGGAHSRGSLVAQHVQCEKWCDLAEPVISGQGVWEY